MSQRENIMGRFGRIAASLACAGLLAACSSTPDWANPVEWYKGASSAFESEPDPEVAKAREEARENKQTSPGSDGETPNLSSVPERPTDLGSQRSQVQQGLAADREQARYADVDTSPQDDGSLSSSAPADAPPPPPVPSDSASGDAAASESIPNSSGASESPKSSDSQVAARESGSDGTMAERAAASPSTGSSPSGPSSPDSSVASSASAPMQPSETQSARPVPPSEVAPEVPKPIMPEGDEVRRTYEEALQQSATSVTTAPAGLRDMNHSPVVNRRNTMPVQPSSMGEERVTLRPPPGVQSVGLLPAGEADAVVYFANASSKVSGSARNELKNIVNIYKERGGRVRVVGHASSRTRNINEVAHRLANFEVSLDRAQAVARELARLGVPMEKISVQAMADNDPVYYEVMPAGEAGNRRAEIFLDY